MEKIINFGKIDANNSGRKINKVEIEINLENDRLSICGSVWNSKNTDIIMGGQCLDSLLPYFKHNKKFLTIYDLWKNYHLNDMQAGSPNQTAFIESLNLDNHSYEIVCKELEKHDLLIDKNYIHNDKPYQYGTAWLFKALPNNINELITSL